MQLPKQDSTAHLTTGTLCLYENDGRPLLGVVLGLRRDKYGLLNQRGREVELPRFRLHALPTLISSDLKTSESQIAWMTQVYDQALKNADQVKLEELWDVASSQPKDYDSAELASLLYSKPNIEQLLAVRLALISDKIFFKRKEAAFEPRTLAIVEELKKSEQSRIEKLNLQKSAIEYFSKRIKDAQLTCPENLQPLIGTMLEVAANCPDLDNNRIKEAKDLVDICAEQLKLNFTGSREQRMTRFLEVLKFLTPNTNLAFVRHRYKFNYSPEAYLQANQLTIPQNLAAIGNSLCQDLTHLPCFTIDDESTKDMDDAVSIEQHAGGFTVGIHISDVASFIQPGTALDREALKRATSIYAPERVANMLPPILAENKFSLLVGEIRAAISCIVEIGQDFEIKSNKIIPSLIKVSQRYTYNQADELLYLANSPLHNIFTITSSLETKRIKSGALRVGKKEMLASILPDGDFKLYEIDENSPARNMIGELMVLANAIFAEYGVKNNLPLVYRGQDNPELENRTDSGTVPEGSARDYSIKAKMKKSFTSTEPARHASLALNAYIQASSPIRRYADILNQRQILQHLRFGDLAHSSDQMRDFIKQLEEPLATAQSISKTTKRFWLLRQLEKMQAAKQTVTATVLRTDLRNPLVEIHEVILPTLVRLDRPVSPGDILKLKILKIDSRNDFLRLEEVRDS